MISGTGHQKFDVDRIQAVADRDRHSADQLQTQLPAEDRPG
jgi:hypothetical protein